MPASIHLDSGPLGELLPEERERLVRLCATLSRDADAAEDLAQETLFEAWRSTRAPRDESDYSRWLSGIANNVCLRHARKRGKELSLMATRPCDARDVVSSVEGFADLVDIELDLERQELMSLLDRAMALLSPENRAVLIERYVHELPQVETALRLNIGEGAVAVRLHRGKLALRRVLSTHLAAEAQSYGLYSEDDTLRETSLWCPACGQRHLVGRLNPATGELYMRCLDCTPAAAIVNTATELLRGIRGYRAAITRLMEDANAFYEPALRSGSAACATCGGKLSVHIAANDLSILTHLRYCIRTRCAECSAREQTMLLSATLSLPQGRRFYAQHPRLRALPERDIESGGRRAVVASVEDVASGARYDVVIALEPYAVLGVYRS